MTKNGITDILDGLTRGQPSTQQVADCGNNILITAIDEIFDAGIPGAWSVVDNEGKGLVWTTVVGSGIGGNYTKGSNDAASASSDAFGPAEFDTELITLVIILPANSSNVEYRLYS
jgi:hypothetical protein